MKSEMVIQDITNLDWEKISSIRGHHFSVTKKTGWGENKKMSKIFVHHGQKLIFNQNFIINSLSFNEVLKYMQKRYSNGACSTSITSNSNVAFMIE